MKPTPRIEPSHPACRAWSIRRSASSVVSSIPRVGFTPGLRLKGWFAGGTPFPCRPVSGLVISSGSGVRAIPRRASPWAAESKKTPLRNKCEKKGTIRNGKVKNTALQEGRSLGDNDSVTPQASVFTNVAASEPVVSPLRPDSQSQEYPSSVRVPTPPPFPQISPSPGRGNPPPGMQRGREALRGASVRRSLKSTGSRR